MKKSLSIAVALAVLAISGCGSDDQKANSSTSATTGSPDSSAPATTAGGAAQQTGNTSVITLPSGDAGLRQFLSLLQASGIGGVEFGDDQLECLFNALQDKLTDDDVAGLADGTSSPETNKLAGLAFEFCGVDITPAG